MNTLIEKIENLQNNFQSDRIENMNDFFKRINEIKEVPKATYTIPPKDTIGRNIYSLMTKK